MKLIVVPTIEGPLKAMLYTEDGKYPWTIVNTDMFYSMKKVWEKLNAGQAIILEVRESQLDE